MTTRQKRLDSLSQIIRHSESLYDVTALVAAGTNHILHLAYVITENFFLPCEASRTTIKEVRWNVADDDTGDDGLHLKWPNHSRANSWLDAFIRCPRAYLLISNSVDYSLAVGRLPEINSLPRLICNITAKGGMFEFPWAMCAPAGDMSICAPYKNHVFVDMNPHLDSMELGVNVQALRNAANDQTSEAQVKPRERCVRSDSVKTIKNRHYVHQFPKTGHEHNSETALGLSDPHNNFVNLDFFNLRIHQKDSSISSAQREAEVYGNTGSILFTVVNENLDEWSCMGIDDENSQEAVPMVEGLDTLLCHSLFHTPLADGDVCE
jgi:hypothetical protein